MDPSFLGRSRNSATNQKAWLGPVDRGPLRPTFRGDCCPLFLDADGCFNIDIGQSPTHFLGKGPQIQVRAKQKDPFLPQCMKTCWGGSLAWTPRDSCTAWSLTAVHPKKKGLFSWFEAMDLDPLQSPNQYTQYVLLRKAFL